MPNSCFGVIVIDVWHPGNQVQSEILGNILVLLDSITVFSLSAFLVHLNSTQVRVSAFTQYFVGMGFQRMIIIDSSSDFVGALLQMCKVIALN